MIVKEMGSEEAKEAPTPGEEENKWEENENKQELKKEEATKYRGLAARANCLAQDRPDIMYATKEICRHMASPSTGAWKKMKRLGRYLKGKRRLVLKYEWQKRGTEIEGYSDSDWAGCRVTGKSTSGGVIMVGGHFIKGWSRTQGSVTLSSAEAELVAMCKLSAEMIAIMTMLKEWGHTYNGYVYAESSAALAIAKRKGSGKLRHINIGLLWIQERKERKKLEFAKIKGENNPADLITKYVTRFKVEEHTQQISGNWKTGRAESGLQNQGQTKEQ